MNVLLWVIQISLAALYGIAGFTKIFMFETFAQQVASTKAVPQAGWVVIAIFELFCVLGLILPAATRIHWPVTAVAASGLAVEGLLVGVLHGMHGEHSPMAFSLLLAALAAFLAYARFALEPL